MSLASMTIQEIAAAVASGAAPIEAAFAIVDARVQRRIISGATQYAKVNRYRNELAEELMLRRGAPGSIPLVDEKLKRSVVAKPQQAALVAGEVLDVADQVFDMVGASQVAAVIARLTSRLMAASH